MSTHSICFYGELTKIILQLSSNTLLICSAGLFPMPFELSEMWIALRHLTDNTRRFGRLASFARPTECLADSVNGSEFLRQFKCITHGLAQMKVMRDLFRFCSALLKALGTDPALKVIYNQKWLLWNNHHYKTRNIIQMFWVLLMLIIATTFLWVCVLSQ